MPAHAKDPMNVASRTRAARITPAEDAALERLLERRASDLEARAEPGDPSFAGWLRWIIRREARDAGIVIETSRPVAPPSAPSKRAAPAAKKGARSPRKA